MSDANGLMLVMQTPKQGREKEHLDWYLSTHLPDVCRVPGTVRGEFTAATVIGSNDNKPRWSNAALYWVDGDPAAYLAEVLRRAGTGEWKLIDSLDQSKVAMTVGEPLTPRLRSKVDADLPPAERLIFIVLTNATPGDDDVFNEWYSDTHIPDVLDVPGFIAAQRFRLLDVPNMPPPPYRYAALYEVRKADAEAAFAELSARAGTERMVLSPTLDTNDVHAVPFASAGIVNAA